MRDIAPILIEKFKFERLKTPTRFKRERSPSTVNRELQVLSRVLSMAYENSVIDSNPMSRVKRLREPQGRERYLTPEEEEKLLEALATYGEHLPALVIFALETGMRLGEMLNARWEHINSMNQTIYIPQTKTDKPRCIPLSAKALKILRSLRQDAPEEELIFDWSRTGRKRRQMMICFESAVTKAALADFHFHDLHHTFATQLRAAGTHEMDMMTLLGHSTLKMTPGYSHAVPLKLRTAIDSLAQGRVLCFAPTSRQVVGEAEGSSDNLSV